MRAYSFLLLSASTCYRLYCTSGAGTCIEHIYHYWHQTSVSTCKDRYVHVFVKMANSQANMLENWFTILESPWIPTVIERLPLMVPCMLHLGGYQLEDMNTGRRSGSSWDWPMSSIASWHRLTASSGPASPCEGMVKRCPNVHQSVQLKVPHWAHQTWNLRWLFWSQQWLLPPNNSFARQPAVMFLYKNIEKSNMRHSKKHYRDHDCLHLVSHSDKANTHQLIMMVYQWARPEFSQDSGNYQFRYTLGSVSTWSFSDGPLTKLIILF